jgi:arginase
MKNVRIIGACTDLGLQTNGTDKGPKVIIEKLDKDNDIIFINKPECIKSTDSNDLRKNLKEVNIFNNNLFNEVKSTIESGKYPITVGGDHSLAIGSALASNQLNGPIGVIWVDAHLDYNTFETTITGNLHGLPLAAINGICKDLTPFTNNFINPKNTVVVGYRAKEENREAELSNIKRMGVTVFDDEYIRKYGIELAMEKAIEIATNNTNGTHISFDLDVIDASFSPGVSVPEPDGIDLDSAYKVKDIIIKNIDKVKSFDLVEYNPDLDVNNITRDIALNILNDIINAKK